MDHQELRGALVWLRAAIAVEEDALRNQQPGEDVWSLQTKLTKRKLLLSRLQELNAALLSQQSHARESLITPARCLPGYDEVSSLMERLANHGD